MSTRLLIQSSVVCAVLGMSYGLALAPSWAQSTPQSTPQATTQAPGAGAAEQQEELLDTAEQHGLCARTLSVAAEKARADGRDQLATTYGDFAAQDTEAAMAGGADAQMFSDAALNAVRVQTNRNPLDFLAVLDMCLQRHGMTLHRKAESKRYPDWPQAPKQGYSLQPGDLALEPR